jgi:3-oxoacyl-[acyl-carrier-protein] synthase II
MSRRVVVTGLGAVCPVGTTMPAAWDALLHGRSGIGRITLFDPSPYEVQIAGEVKGFSIAGRVDPKRARHMDRHVQFAVVAAQEALADANVTVTAENRDRVGVIVGSAAGGVQTLLNAQHTLETRGPDRVNPFFLPNFLADAATGHIAIETGAAGPNFSTVSACATGGHAIGEAMHTIARGDADIVIAGGTDTVVLPITLAGFINMKGLASDNEHPARASRPFDKDRGGFVISEAAAVLILEELEHARARDAHIYAEVVGYGATNDAFHMFAQAEDGEGAARAMSRALHSAALNPDEVDYINAHGTGTPLNDRVETHAIKRVFGPRAYALAVSSTKSMTGHMMGASGALEGAICALVIRHGVIPPTINLETPDPECDLDYVPHTAREQKVRVAVSNSIGLGGHNATIILRAL